MTWYNPETKRFAYWTDRLDVCVLWVDTEVKSASVFGEFNDIGYFSTEISHHGLTEANSSLLLTQLLIISQSLHSSQPWPIHVEKSVLDPGGVLNLHQYVEGDLSGVKWNLVVFFREILAIVSGNSFN